MVSLSGSRWVSYKDFHTGYKQMDRAPDELLKSIRMPRFSGERRSYYKKVGTRRAQAISKVCMASTAVMEGKRIVDIKLAFGSVAPIPLRCVATEQVLKGREISAELHSEARTTVLSEIIPIDDIRSTVAYRARVSANLLVDWLKTLAN